jgi:AcrR family transcriptional regulator
VTSAPADRRKQIVDAGLALLAEEGLAGLTQPRVAARTGLRQSHLTYYFPTRAALLAAVARAAVDQQSATAAAMAAHATSVADAAVVIAAGTARHEATRVLVALSQAADQEPEVRALFNQLAENSLTALKGLLTRLDLPATEVNADLLRALFIGLAVNNLAAGHADAQARAQAALDAAFRLIAQPAPSSRASKRATKSKET